MIFKSITFSVKEQKDADHLPGEVNAGSGHTIGNNKTCILEAIKLEESVACFL